MKKITVNKTRILTAAAALVAVFSLAGCGQQPCRRFPGLPRPPAARKPPPRPPLPEATAIPGPHTGADALLWSCPPA